MKTIGNRNLRLVGLHHANARHTALTYDFFRFLRGPRVVRMGGRGRHHRPEPLRRQCTIIQEISAIWDSPWKMWYRKPNGYYNAAESRDRYKIYPFIGMKF